MKPDHINLLKSEVEKIFGRRILSSADCQNLCEAILQTCGIKISFNTVRRYFNLMKSTSQPSSFTLNTLCNYCGYSSFDDFVIVKRPNEIAANQTQDHIVLSYLTLFFKQIEVCKKTDLTYLSLVQQTILHLEHYPSIIDRFQREIAKTKNGQSFYFEQFIFIDKLNSYYGSGLHYYLNEKKTREAQLFGHSLLCFRAWLIQDYEGVEKHSEKVMECGVDESISHPVNARYFATQLYYAHVFGVGIEAIIVEARRFYLSMLRSKEDNTGLNCFEVIIAEALILTSQYEEALFYIDEVLKNVKTNIPSYIDVALYENVSLLKSIVFAHTGKKLKAYEILQDINPYKYSFLSRQYLNILYLSNKQFLRNNNEDEMQIRHLIAETGFVALRSIWQNTYAPVDNN